VSHPLFQSFSSIPETVPKLFMRSSSCSKAFQTFLQLFPSFLSIPQAFLKFSNIPPAFQAFLKLFLSFSSVPPAVPQLFKRPTSCSKTFQASLSMMSATPAIHSCMCATTMGAETAGRGQQADRGWQDCSCPSYNRIK
jgi:hypothetical protein